MSLLSHFSHVQLSATPWTTACQASLPIGFSRQEYWSGLPFTSSVIKYEVNEVKLLSHVRLFATPWTAACQAPLSVGFSRQKYWNGLPCPPPGNLPNPGELSSLKSPALASGFFTIGATWEAKDLQKQNIWKKKNYWYNMDESQKYLIQRSWTWKTRFWTIPFT